MCRSNLSNWLLVLVCKIICLHTSYMLHCCRVFDLTFTFQICRRGILFRRQLPTEVGKVWCRIFAIPGVKINLKNQEYSSKSISLTLLVCRISTWLTSWIRGFFLSQDRLPYHYIILIFGFIQNRFYSNFLFFRYYLNLFLLNKIQLTIRENLIRPNLIQKIPCGKKWNRRFSLTSHTCCSYLHNNKQCITQSGGILR